MTPLYLHALKAIWPRVDTPTGRSMLSSKVFDMRDVEPLIAETAIELKQALLGTEAPPLSDQFASSHTVDLGERCVGPAADIWLEFSAFSLRLYAMPKSHGWGVSQLERSDAGVRYASAGYIAEEGDGHFFVEMTRPDHPVGRTIGMDPIALALAAFAVINSPALEKRVEGPHKGWNKRISGAGIRDAITSHVVITIGANRRSSKADVLAVASPKAYHFCRAHTRRCASGTIAPVRAHWRGDAAFGVRIGSYRPVANRALN